MDIEPGIYHDVPDPVYRSWTYPSQSVLKQRCALDMRTAFIEKSKPTGAMRFGTCFHDLMEADDPDAVARKWQPFDQMKNPKTKRLITVNEALPEHCWDALDDLCVPDDKVPVGADWPETLLSMRQAVLDNGEARSLRESVVYREVSLVWDHYTTGVRCKARLDAVGRTWDGRWFIVDYKTVRGDHLDAGQFTRDMLMGARPTRYHAQMSFYADGLLQVLDEHTMPPDVFIVAVTKTETPEAAVYELDENLLELGRVYMNERLHMWSEAIGSGVWPGPPERELLVAPHWMLARLHQGDEL